MAKQKDFCVIGLGNFGNAVLGTILSLNQSVIAIDIDEERIKRTRSKFPQAKFIILDATDNVPLVNHDISNTDTVIVAIGSDMLASILVTTSLIELKVHKIIAKAIDERHERILRALGIKKIVKPDISAGRQTAIKAVWDLEIDIKDIDNEFAMISAQVRNPELLGTELSNLTFFNDKRINFIRITRDKNIFLPDQDTKLIRDDQILFIAKTQDIQSFYNFITNENISNN